MLKIQGVIKNLIADELGIKPNDEILFFDGFEAIDLLDYLYYDSQTFFTLTVKSGDEIIDYEIEKDEDESLGVTFASDNLEVKTCRNKCLFCFVDQMPKGMRPSLYLKDDDYRQSFLHGNFVTLTNVSSAEIDRIIRLKLSPLYVSVHVTDSEVRKKLLGNRFAGDILEKLKKLSDNGIKLHTQVVLVPYLNDGAILDKTCRDLFALKGVQSVAVVPCGITRHRENLYKIDDVDVGYANCVIEQIKGLNSEFNRNFIQPADEFYFKSKRNVESVDFYGDFSQIENGVGVTAKFESELNSSLKKAKNTAKYLLITGTSAYNFISTCAKKVETYVSGLQVNVLGVENKFFGSTVNCTGLLVGEDILNACKPIVEREKYTALILPSVCLKCDEEVFLDGLSVKSLSEKLKLDIIITDGSGESFYSSLSGGKNLRIVK